MIVPPDMLSEEALRNVVLEFVSREGTDYGHRDFTMDEKVESVLAGIRTGQILINFDDVTQTCNLITKEEAQGR